MPTSTTRPLVAHAYRATKTPRSHLCQRGDWTIFYRGASMTGPGSNSVATTQSSSLVRSANFLAAERFLGSIQSGGLYILWPATGEFLNSSDILRPSSRAQGVACHSTGNIAPWAMTNHAIVSA